MCLKCVASHSISPPIVLALIHMKSYECLVPGISLYELFNKGLAVKIKIIL